MKRSAIKNFVIFILLPACLFSAAGRADAVVDMALQDFLKMQEKTEKKLREEKRKRAQLELEQLKKQEERLKEDESGKEKTGEEEAERIRFMISEIEVENSYLLGCFEKKKLLEPYLNRELGIREMNNLVAGITNKLIDKGYITTRVKIPPDQDLKSGKLLLVIEVGKVESIGMENGGLSEKMQVFTAFPFLEGEALNISDLDEGVEQMNKLGSNNVTMKIYPGTEDFTSKIIINNTPGNRLSLDAGMDNLGQTSTGLYRKKYTAGLDDLFSLNDNLYFNYTDTRWFGEEGRYSRSYVASFTVPLGYWTFGFIYSGSDFMTYVYGLNQTYEVRGGSGCFIASVEDILYRHKYSIFKVRSTFTRKSMDNYIENEKVEVQTFDLSIFNFGFTYINFLFGGYFTLSASYDRGLPVFGAARKMDDATEYTPDPQAGKFSGSVTWDLPVSISGRNCGYSFLASGQYGLETLYSTEQITIGDFSTVRGFRDYSIQGDRGYYTRNEVWVSDFSYIWKYLKGLRLFTGYDYGYTRDKAGSSSDNGRGIASVSGVCAGIAYSEKLVNWNVTYSRKIKYEDFITDDRNLVYFMVTVSLSEGFTGLRDWYRK